MSAESATETNAVLSGPVPLRGQTLREYLVRFGQERIIQKIAKKEKTISDAEMNSMREAIMFCESPISSSQPTVYAGDCALYMRTICQLALSYYDHQQAATPETGVFAMFPAFTSAYWERRAISNFIKELSTWLSPPPSARSSVTSSERPLRRR